MLAVLVASVWSTGCAATGATDVRTPAAPSQTRSPDGAAPDACVDRADATGGSVAGTPEWARFCPGPRGRTAPAEVPSDALTTHLEQLAGLVEVDERDLTAAARCERWWGRSYRLQVGYADGRVTTVVGRTDPRCVGRVPGSGVRISSPGALGVYGTVMAAFGQQYADRFDEVGSDLPLVCPDDPRRPDSVDVDGSSALLDTGYHLGVRHAMTMPLPAVRGILCTWPAGAEDHAPAVRDLTSEEAERVRIGLHAIAGGMVDCARSREPTYTAVVEDRTGSRRAVTVVGSECSTVVRSDRGYGLGFAWLDR